MEATTVRDLEGVRRALEGHGPGWIRGAAEILDAFLRGLAGTLSYIEAYVGLLHDQTFIALAIGEWLDEHGAERSVPRLRDEADSDYRERVASFEERVSPNAIRAHANAILATGEVTLIEHQKINFLLDTPDVDLGAWLDRRIYDGERRITLRVPPQVASGARTFWLHQGAPASLPTAGTGSTASQVSDPESVVVASAWNEARIRLRPGATTAETRTIAEARRTWLLTLAESLATSPALSRYKIALSEPVEFGIATSGSEAALRDAVKGPSWVNGQFVARWVCVRPGQATEETREIIISTPEYLIWQWGSSGAPLNRAIEPGDPYLVVYEDLAGLRSGVAKTGSTTDWLEDDAPLPTAFTADSETGRFLVVRPGETTQEVVEIADTFETVLFRVETPFDLPPAADDPYDLAEADAAFSGDAVLRRSYLVDGAGLAPSGKRPACFLDGEGPAPSDIYGELYGEIERIRAAGVRSSIVIE